MAALDEGEEMSVFEILEAFWDSTGTVSDGFGIQLTLTELDSLKSDIRTRIAAFSDAANVKVRELIAEYDDVKGGDFAFEGGSIGSLGGIKMSSAQEQAKIRKRLLTYLPVMHMADALKQKRGPTGSASAQIGFMRN